MNPVWFVTWFARPIFIIFVLVAYALQRELEKKREDLKLFDDSAPSCLRTSEEWWTREIKPRKERANELRNLRDLLLGCALVLFLADLWLI